MSNVPMSNPELMIACHQPFPFNRGGMIPMRSGRLLACAGRGMGYSDDGGLTWCEPYEAGYDRGEEPDRPNSGVPFFQNLVELEDGVIGAVELRRRTGAHNWDRDIYFSTSRDMGRTWVENKRIDTGLSRSFFFQNVLTRLSSGRLLLPVFAQYGWGYPPHDQRIITGGYVDGEFTPTGAHCYEATIGVCYVVYSDDQGQTWQRNLDCELVAYLDDGSFHGLFEPSVAEVKPGTLLMFMRNLLGRIFESWSYDNGETWSPPQPTQLSASGSPSLIQKLPATDDLLCIWNQQSAEEMRLGYYRTRLSAAVSRNGGGLWEFFQNVESIHEQRRIEPSPLHMARPQGQFALHPGKKAYENDSSSVVDLDERFGIWTNHTFCVLEDRVLVMYAGKCKILPLNWFYRGRDPHAESPLLQKLMHGTHGS